MSERRRMTGFEAKIASMEAELAKLKKFAAQKAAASDAPKTAAPVAKAAPKKATSDSDLMQMKNEAVKKDNDMVGWDAEAFEMKAPAIMSQISALEDKLNEDDGEPKANYENDQNERVVEMEHGKDDEKMIVNDPQVVADEEVSDDEVKMEASDDEDSDEGWDAKSAAAPGIEDTIENDHEQMVDEFDPNAPKGQGLEVVRPAKMASKNVEAKERYASMIRQATSRLDKVASYLEKNGRKELAYRLDKVSDALEAKLTQK